MQIKASFILFVLNLTMHAKAVVEMSEFKCRTQCYMSSRNCRSVVGIEGSKLTLLLLCHGEVLLVCQTAFCSEVHIPCRVNRAEPCCCHRRLRQPLPDHSKRHRDFFHMWSTREELPPLHLPSSACNALQTQPMPCACGRLTNTPMKKPWAQDHS